MNGMIVGYEPGGGGHHGVAALRIQEGEPTDITVDTLATVEHVIRWMEGVSAVVGLGIDTLSC